MMRLKFVSCMIIWLAAFFVVSSSLPDAYAQQGRRRRPSRRVTNPVRTQSQTTTPANSPTQDAQIISTAEGETAREGNNASSENNAGASDSTRATNEPRRSTRSEQGNASDGESLQRTVNRLSTQVTRLAEDLNQLKQQQRTLVNLERLTRAEQRAESLRAQQRDVLKQEADLQARSEQLDYDLQSENIERRTAASGSTRPEEARAQLQRQLEGERTRVRAQLDVLTTSRTRLETAVANADAEVDRLRQIIERDTNAETQNGVDSNRTNTDTNTQPPADAPPRDTPSSVPPLRY